MTIKGPLLSPSVKDSSSATLLSLFVTPAAKMRCPFAAEINPGLVTSILGAPESETKSLHYKSETAGNITEWKNPEVERLSSWVLRAARVFVENVLGHPLHEAVDAAAPSDVLLAATRCWASVYRRGDHHPAHYHPNTAISAIYYVSAASRCELELDDPRGNVDLYDPGITFANEGARVRVTCGPGDLLLLPGWVKHQVPPYNEQEVRISIAWNLGYRFSSSINLKPAGD